MKKEQKIKQHLEIRNSVYKENPINIHKLLELSSEFKVTRYNVYIEKNISVYQQHTENKVKKNTHNYTVNNTIQNTHKKIIENSKY